MADSRGNLSLDFLVGFTVFMLAFIWVAAMVSGILVGPQANTIDYEAVAYRTGVILVEDPGFPVSPPWESKTDLQKFDVSRFGLALTKETPGILSQEKLNRLFCSTFIYPDDYQTRAIFGTHPYHFNISVSDVERGTGQSVGEILPDGYGYIRRLAKIKGYSNASINLSYIQKFDYMNTTTSPPSAYNVSHHEFSILVNLSKLEAEMKNPAYQIDPSREQIMINISDVRSTLYPAPIGPGTYPPSSSINITLSSIKAYIQNGNTLSYARPFNTPYIDGNSSITVPPFNVNDNVSLVINPRSFDIMQAGYSKVYINLSFDLNDGTAAKNPMKASFLNNTLTAPFEYNYHAANVTQPRLRDAVVEVAVW